jgi:hypothetical protein
MFPLPLAQIPEAVTATAVAANDSGIDVNALAKNANGNPVMLLALGAVSLLGGKKVWELWQKRQEAQHEEKMAQIEATKSSHAECQAKQTQLEDLVRKMVERVADLEGRTIAAERKAQDVITTAEAKVAELEDKLGKVRKKIVADLSEKQKKLKDQGAKPA